MFSARGNRLQEQWASCKGSCNGIVEGFEAGQNILMHRRVLVLTVCVRKDKDNTVG